MFGVALTVLENVLSHLPLRQHCAYPHIVALLRNKRAYGFPYIIGILLLMPDPGRATMPGIVPKPVSMVF
jgi:hypothetical protein